MLKSNTLFLSKKEAAQRLGVSVRTIERYIDQGLLTASAISPGTIRVHGNSIDDLVERTIIVTTKTAVMA